MEAMQTTSLCLLILTTLAAIDRVTSDEVANLERIITIVKQQEHTIKQLEATVDGFNQKSADLARALATVKQQEHRIKHLETELRGSNPKKLALLLSQQTFRVEQIEAELANLQREYTKETCAHPRNSPIAFTAALPTSFSGGGDNAVVPYSTIVLNHGDAYSATDYHFTAPVRGIYFFTISLFTTGRGKIQISVNGNGMVVAEDGDNAGGDSISAILMLEAGDRVACIKPRNGDILTEGVNDPYFNVFAGFLYTPL